MLVSLHCDMKSPAVFATHTRWSRAAATATVAWVLVSRVDLCRCARAVQRREAERTGNEMYLSGKRTLYSNFDSRTLGALRNVDWHGTEEYKAGSVWNQWEQGEGTGGGRVSPHITDDYMWKLRQRIRHGDTMDSDEERETLDKTELTSDDRTLMQKRLEREKKPGILPAPQVATSRPVVSQSLPYCVCC